MTINLHLPSHTETLKPKITVIGVGGAGGNAVNNMIAANLEGVDFVIANTDSQALESALTDRTIQLGVSVTRGLGAGANPQIGQAAAEEALDDIVEFVNGSNMVFITAGMGGGTGTGAAPVIAQLAREQGMLTVGVVTKPFHFEGTHRMRIAERGIEELQQYVDTLIVIPNQNLFRIANEKTTFADAFRMADEVLHSGVRGVTDLMVKPGLVNLDFADIRAVMSEMGKAMMGTGEADSDRRAIDAAEAAISNPLLDDVSLKGARAVLINITGGPDMTLFEVDEAANRIRDEVDPEANIIFGSTFSDSMAGRMRVSVVATGIESASLANRDPNATTRHYPAPANAGKQPEKVAKPTAAKTASHINIQPRHEFKRERTPAEIVRDSANAASLELARKGGYGNPKADGQPQAPQQHAPATYQEHQQQLQQQQQMNESSYESEQGSLAIDEPLLETSYANDERKKPFKLGEVKEQIDGPAFIAPRPEQSGQRTFVQSQPAEYEEEEADGGGLNFFQKIAGVGKALAHKGHEQMTRESPRAAASSEPQMRSRAQVKENAAPDFAEDEEYLDIPAFLRRQAN
jgi:cell division protein FtsZ